MRRFILLLVLAVTGCSTVERVAGPTDWDARRTQVLLLERWRMTGRVAVTVDGDGASASIDWRQDGESSDLALSGPLGAGALRAQFDRGGLLLEDASGAQLRGREAERLLVARLGTELPLRSLRYWLLGAPAPGTPFDGNSGTAGQPAGFRQDGWQVDITRFAATHGRELPVRLTLARDGARLRLAVSRWELPP